MLIKDQLQKLGVRPSKNRGQNFLFQSTYCEQLIKAVEIREADPVIEVGPGLGALTKFIFDRTKNLTCIEIEKAFIEYLSRSVSSEISFINADFRKVDLSERRNRYHLKPKIISNLPYVFSTDAILWLISYRQYFSRASLLVQKEFAERIAAEPHSKAYGSITVHAQFYLDVTLGVEVPGSAFHPPTKVPSQQLVITPKEKLTKIECPEEFFESVVRAGFSMRRKTLINCLTSKLDYGKDEIENIFGILNINLKARAENINIQEFGKLSDELFKVKRLR